MRTQLAKLIIEISKTELISSQTKLGAMRQVVSLVKMYKAHPNLVKGSFGTVAVGGGYSIYDSITIGDTDFEISRGINQCCHTQCLTPQLKSANNRSDPTVITKKCRDELAKQLISTADSTAFALLTSLKLLITLKEDQKFSKIDLDQIITSSITGYLDRIKDEGKINRQLHKKIILFIETNPRVISNTTKKTGLLNLLKQIAKRNEAK